MDSASDIIGRLGLQPHPEGGHYREIYRHAPDAGGRGACTAIYYLLAEGEVSAWHRIDAVEIWHWYAGAPLRLSVAAPEADPVDQVLGIDLAAGQRPQAVVPPFRLAKRPATGRVESGRLHGGASLPVFRLRVGPTRVAARITRPPAVTSPA